MVELDFTAMKKIEVGVLQVLQMIIEQLQMGG